VAFFENGVVGFVSNNDDGVDSLADQSSGFLIPLRANIVDILEVGPEGANGFFYTPAAGQPGFTPDFAVTYLINQIANRQRPLPNGSNCVAVFIERDRARARSTQ
jgi:hypothetical protein